MMKGGGGGGGGGGESDQWDGAQSCQLYMIADCKISLIARC